MQSLEPWEPWAKPHLLTTHTDRENRRGPCRRRLPPLKTQGSRDKVTSNGAERKCEHVRSLVPGPTSSPILLQQAVQPFAVLVISLVAISMTGFSLSLLIEASPPWERRAWGTSLAPLLLPALHYAFEVSQWLPLRL